MAQHTAPQSSARIAPGTSTPTYELVDVTTGTLIGAYTDEWSALVAVLQCIDSSGEQPGLSLALGLDDPTGLTDGRLIATGQDLVDLARRRRREWLGPMFEGHVE